LQNVYLDERIARDIDKRVAKILKDLDNPEPPLRLELVRELLRLDLAFYTTADDGVLNETVHRLMMAGKQLLARPSLLLDAVKKWDLKALWVPDRRRILLDTELPSSKQRWGEAHEIGHSILPWHEPAMHGDRNRTLSHACEQQVESEANYAAGRLIFLQDVFTEHLRSSELCFPTIKSLGTLFKNTMTSTLWRAIEVTEPPAFGLVSQHPRDVLGEEPIRYFVRSRAFGQQFGNVQAMHVFHELRSFCFGRKGPIGEAEVLFRNLNGEQHIFFVQSFHNHYEVLTLGVYRRAQQIIF
jgi:hypothetical protein